jgi:hypothetical protein
MPSRNLKEDFYFLSAHKKTSLKLCARLVLQNVALTGFEPIQSESKSEVLPLDDRAIGRQR